MIVYYFSIHIIHTFTSLFYTIFNIFVLVICYYLLLTAIMCYYTLLSSIMFNYC
nr:MAG TPA: hypothetical protein [Caudoviricetes sp.]